MKLKAKSAIAALGLSLAAVVGGPATAAHALSPLPGCEEIGNWTYFETHEWVNDLLGAPSIPVGTLAQEWCPNGVNGDSPGSRVAVGIWQWGAALQPGNLTFRNSSIWLENGPNTHTLASVDLTARGAHEGDRVIVAFPIDALAYPKTVDVAAHIVYDVYDGESTVHCDLWQAGTVHQYSTGNNSGNVNDVTRWC